MCLSGSVKDSGDMRSSRDVKRSNQSDAVRVYVQACCFPSSRWLHVKLRLQILPFCERKPDIPKSEFTLSSAQRAPFFFSFAVVGSGPCVCDGDGGERECLLAATALAPIIGHMYFAKLYF